VEAATLQATKAFLADHASARAVVEAILPLLASVDIDLGQHELVDDVLGVDARACVAARSERSGREPVRAWVCSCQPELGVA
jgi:hypothetical protein